MREILIKTIGDYDIIKHSHYSGYVKNKLTGERVPFIKYNNKVIFVDINLIPNNIIYEITNRFVK